MEQHLTIPLPLGEMLFCVLGPMVQDMDPDSGWAVVARMVLRAYTEARDNALTQQYGSHIVKDIDIVTQSVAEEMAQWLDGLVTEAETFEKWEEELGDE